MYQSIRIKRIVLINHETKEQVNLIPFNAYWKGLGDKEENFHEFHSALKHYLNLGFIVQDIQGALK
jgi:hypothetical protein